MSRKRNSTSGGFKTKYTFQQDRPCSRCKVLKSADEFSPRTLPSGNLSRMSRCKECLCELVAFSDSLRTPEEIARDNIKMKEYHAKNKDRAIYHNRKSGLKRSFNLTIEEYYELSEKQNNLCGICFQPETEISVNSRYKKPKHLAVDHCHNTEKIRGLLCSKCNKALGNFKDSIELLENAITYLKKHNENN